MNNPTTYQHSHEGKKASEGPLISSVEVLRGGLSTSVSPTTFDGEGPGPGIDTWTVHDRARDLVGFLGRSCGADVHLLQ